MTTEEFFEKTSVMMKDVVIDKKDEDCPDSVMIIATYVNEPDTFMTRADIAGQVSALVKGLEVLMEGDKRMASVLMTTIILHCETHQDDLRYLIEQLQDKCNCTACLIKRKLLEVKRKSNSSNPNVN